MTSPADCLLCAELKRDWNQQAKNWNTQTLKDDKEIAHLKAKLTLREAQWGRCLDRNTRYEIALYDILKSGPASMDVKIWEIARDALEG